MSHKLSYLLAMFLGTASWAEESPVPSAAAFGGAVAPAVLPPGSSSVYGFVGAQEVGGGFRQGLGGVELEVRAAFNYLLLSLGGDVVLKFPPTRVGQVDLAPYGGLGLSWDSGSRYFDRVNFSYLALRPRVGGVAVMELAETVRGLAVVDVPWSIAIRPWGGHHFSPLAGGGAEFHLGKDMSALILGMLGPDVLKEPLGVTQVRLGYQLKLALGFRLF